MRSHARQVSAFLVIGIISAAIDAGGFWILTALGVWAPLASGVSFMSAFVVNYRGNRDIVFRSKMQSGSIVRYTVLVAVNLLLSTAGVALGIALGFLPIPSKLATMVLVAILNFFIMRLWVFPTVRSEQAGSSPSQE